MRGVMTLLLLAILTAPAHAGLMRFEVEALMDHPWGTGPIAARFSQGMPIHLRLEFDTASGVLEHNSSTLLRGQLVYTVGEMTFASTDPFLQAWHRFGHDYVPDPTAERGKRPIVYDLISFEGTGTALLAGVKTSLRLYINLLHVQDGIFRPLPQERYLTDLAETDPEYGWVFLVGNGQDQGEYRTLVSFDGIPTSIRGGPVERTPEPGSLLLAVVGGVAALGMRRSRR